MFMALWIFYSLVAFYGFRRFFTYSTYFLSMPSKQHPWYTTYYFWWYIFLALLFWLDFFSFVHYDIIEFRWLTDTDKMTSWHIGLEEAELEKYKMPTWLRWTSISTPIFVVLTGLVSFWQTQLHHRHLNELRIRIIEQIGISDSDSEEKHRLHKRVSQTINSQYSNLLEKYAFGPDMEHASVQNKIIPNDLPLEERVDIFRRASLPHDLSIQVVSLPLVYSLMSFKSVLRCYMVMTGSQARVVDVESFHKAEDTLDQMYDANYAIAELYESWAIMCFCSLCIWKVKMVSEESHWDRNARRLFKPLRSVTLIGVYSFVIVMGLEAIYKLLLSASKESFGYDICSGGFIGKTFCSFKSWQDGAAFVVSSQALYNIVVFETSLERWLEQFEPKWKFVGAKILVSIAFLQTFILQLVLVDLLGILSVEQQKLAYSSLITIQCFPIALLHAKAWDHRADWYTNAANFAIATGHGMHDPLSELSATEGGVDTRRSSMLQTPLLQGHAEGLKKINAGGVNVQNDDAERESAGSEDPEKMGLPKMQIELPDGGEDVRQFI